MCSKPFRHLSNSRFLKFQWLRYKENSTAKEKFSVIIYTHTHKKYQGQFIKNRQKGRVPWLCSGKDICFSSEAEAEPWSPLRERITVLCPPCAPWHMHHHTHPPYTSVKEKNNKITFKKVSQWFYSSDIKLFQHILIINIQEHINRITLYRKRLQKIS